MNEKFRERAVLPLVIPLGGLVFIAIVAIAMSQILLRVPKEIATSVALMTAVSVLITASVLAVRRRLNSFELLFMTGAAAFPLVLGLGVALGVVEVEVKDEHGEQVPTIELAADKLAFETTELEVPSGAQFRLSFTNKEQAPHNVSIFKEGEQTALFTEAPFAGPKTITWEVPALEEGSFPFRCDVHPNMTGVMVASPSEAEADEHGESEADKEEAPEAEAVQISSKDSEFDKDELTLPADTEVSLEFNNLDAQQPHNVAIYETAESTTALFRENPFTGPKRVTWRLPPLKRGNFFFKCDVHPKMNGTVVVT